MATTLAARRGIERNQLVAAAVAAMQAQEAVLQERVELVFDELRQVGACSVFGLDKESCGLLLHQTVQRGLLRAVTLVLNRGAIRRPLGLPASGLHARLLKW